MTNPHSSSVAVLPGVPNMRGLTVDDGIVPFPDTTVDFVKVLRARGLKVEFTVARDDRRYVGHKAFELWLPILEFSRDLFIAIGGGLLVEAIKTYLDPRTEQTDTPELQESEGDTQPATSEPENRSFAPPEGATPAILHIEWHVTKPGGQRDTFVANGSAPDVFRALEEFEQRVRGDEGA